MPGEDAAAVAARTQQLWRARLHISAGRLRSLPEVADGVPPELRQAKMELTMDDAAMASAAPRIHPAPVERPKTDHSVGEFSYQHLLIWPIGDFQS